MRRNEWELEYTAGKLAEAATAKRQYHDERFAWWKAKRKETITKIRAEGIEIDEKIVIGFHDNPKTRDWDGAARVTVRDDLRADLHECQSKLSWHTEKRVEYHGWEQALSANPDVPLRLHIDDWLFFFGK